MTIFRFSLLLLLAGCGGPCVWDIPPGLHQHAEEMCVNNDGLARIVVTETSTGRQGSIYRDHVRGAVYCVDRARFKLNFKAEASL